MGKRVTYKAQHHVRISVGGGNFLYMQKVQRMEGATEVGAPCYRFVNGFNGKVFPARGQGLIASISDIEKVTHKMKLLEKAFERIEIEGIEERESLLNNKELSDLEELPDLDNYVTTEEDF